MNSLSTKQIVDFTEEKRKACAKKLADLLQKGELTRESFQELALQNERLSQILKTSFIKGEVLLQKKVVSSLSQLFVYESKPQNDEEAFEAMKRLVVEGSENPYVRNFAATIAQKSSQRRGTPVAIPPADRLYIDSVDKDDVPNMNAFINHCYKVGEDIYEFVKTRMVYVSDPPDDYYQPAYHTLEILNLKGDCDDLAILLCSLFRSIGYRTFLGFQPHHVFAGVVLAKPIFCTTERSDSEKEEIPVQFVEIPVDPQLEGFEIRLGDKKAVFNGFEIANGEFLSRLNELKKHAAKMSEDDVRKLHEDLGVVRERLSKITNAKIFFIDPIVNTVKIADVFEK